MKRFLSYVLLLFSLNTVFAQKVKYKDLFPMLEVKNYEEAAPALRRYLVQNSDDASAIYQAGLLHEYNTLKDDVVLQNISLVNHADSAIDYYTRARTLITEKELRKRDKYYQEFNRRDLRTGDFGIKLSDVQLSIDRRVESITAYKNTSLFIKQEIETATKTYSAARGAYIYLSRLSDRMNGLYLKSTEVTEESLDYLIDSFDSTMHSLQLAQKHLKEINNTAYLQKLDKKTIVVHKKDGFEEIDLHKAEVELWDYKTWSLDVLEVINTKIKPLRITVKKYKQELGRLIDDRDTDLNALEALGHTPFARDLLDLDEHSVALTYLNLEWAKLKVKLESDSAKNALLSDPMHYDNLIEGHEGVLSDLAKVDSILSTTKRGSELKKESLKYTEFLDEMRDVELLEGSFVDDVAEYQALTKTWSERLENLKELARFGIFENDSIPMFIHIDSTAATNDPGYTSLNRVQDDSSRWYVNGLMNFDGSAKGFIARVEPNRMADWKTIIPIGFVETGEVDFFVSSIAAVGGEEAAVLFYAKIPGESVYRCKLSTHDNVAGLIRWEYSFETQQKPLGLEFGDSVLTVSSGSLDTGLDTIRLDAEGKLLD